MKDYGRSQHAGYEEPAFRHLPSADLDQVPFDVQAADRVLLWKVDQDLSDSAPYLQDLLCPSVVFVYGFQDVARPFTPSSLLVIDCQK